MTLPLAEYQILHIVYVHSCLASSIVAFIYHENFHLLPQFSHVQNVVKGSSAERVCIW